MKKVVIYLSLFLIFLIPKDIYAITNTAKSSIVMDLNSGRVLYEKNSDEKRLIASITKIMTAVLAIESERLDEVVTAGDEVLTMYGTSIYIQKGEKMSLRDLVYGLMLRSGNDAAVVIANYLCDNEEEFVKLMNEKAKEIGMTNTTFENCHGLDEETQNYSTARDMAILTKYAYQLEEYRKISGTKEHTVKTEDKTYLWYNRNKLLTEYEYCTGGKNGYTPSAGKTLVTTSKKDNLEIVVVTLYDNDEYNNHRRLADYAFETYQNYLLVDKDNFSITDDNINGTAYIKESFSYPLSESETKKVKIVAGIDLSIGTGKIGTVKVTLDSKELKSIPIYLKEEEKKEGFFSRLLSRLLNR